MVTFGQLVGEGLGALDVTRVYGRALPGLPHVPVVDPDLAVLLADAAGRIGTGFGAAFLEGNLLHLSSKPGGRAAPLTVVDEQHLADLLSAVDRAPRVPATYALHLDADLGAAATRPRPLPIEPEKVVVTLDPALADLRRAALLGPGVSRGGHRDVAHRFARSWGLPVVNTSATKGLFRWDDPYHGGTAGMQARDFEMKGFGEIDLLVVSGLDPDETPWEALIDAPIQEIEPAQLAASCLRWEEPPAPPARLTSYDELRRVILPLYESVDVPVTGPRAALHIEGARPPGGLVITEAGLPGFWLARALPTYENLSVIVPSTVEPGFAVAGAVAAALDGRPAIAVTGGPLDDTSLRLLDLARSLDLSLAIQVWSRPDEVGTTSVRSVEDHAHLAEAQLATPGVSVEEVPVDLERFGGLIDLAGPIVAWNGLLADRF